MLANMSSKTYATALPTQCFNLFTAELKNNVLIEKEIECGFFFNRIENVTKKETKIDDSYEILPVTPAYNDLGTNIMLH